jgi:hypothetical protein
MLGMKRRDGFLGMEKPNHLRGGVERGPQFIDQNQEVVGMAE